MTVDLSIIRRMKRFLIVFLVFFVACSNSSEESNEVIETTTTTTQETTTTSSITITSSTTTTLVEEEFELDPPKVLINNCPASDINDAVYELLWDIEAGSGDVTSITILVEKDEDIFSNVYFTKEDNADLITFPTAYSKGSYSYQINNTDNSESSAYIIEISIVTEQPNGDLVFAYDLCFANYSPPTTTTSTTTTSTTTTTIYVDNEPPVWSDDPITFSRVNTTQLDILWGLATDNTAIKEYKIYANDVLVATVNEGADKRVTIYNLTPNTQYNFEILACDDENNCSTSNPIATILTSSPTTTTTVPPTTTTTIYCAENPNEDNKNSSNCPKYYLDNEYQSVYLDDANEGELNVSESLYCIDNDNVESGGWFFRPNEKGIQPQQYGVTDDGRGYYIRLPNISQSTYDLESESWSSSGYTEGGVWIYIICVSQ